MATCKKFESEKIQLQKYDENRKLWFLTSSRLKIRSKFQLFQNLWWFLPAVIGQKKQNILSSITFDIERLLGNAFSLPIRKNLPVLDYIGFQHTEPLEKKKNTGLRETLVGLTGSFFQNFFFWFIIWHFEKSGTFTISKFK